MALMGRYFDAVARVAVAAAAPFRLRGSDRGHLSALWGPVAAGQVDMRLCHSAAVSSREMRSLNASAASHWK